MSDKQSQTTSVWCRWKLADLEYSYWDTTCGHAFEVTTGTPLENGMEFCCYCGKKLAETVYAKA